MISNSMRSFISLFHSILLVSQEDFVLFAEKEKGIETYNLQELLKLIKEADGLPENLSTEAQLWDEIFKKQAFNMPELFFPLIKEVHGRYYAPGTIVKPLATEFIIERSPDKRLRTIRADVTLIVGSFDIYHFECQITNDGTMALRMIDYDVQIALTYSSYDKNGNLDIVFPNSAVLYIQNGNDIPSNHKCHLQFQDGSSHDYIIPTIKVQAYTLEEIKSKHLAVLIPFLPLGFRGKPSGKEEVSTFFKRVVVLLEEEVKDGYLSENNRSVIMELLGKSMIRVFYKDDTLIQEVVEMTAPILRLDSEILTETVTLNTYIKNIKSLIEKMNLSQEDALDALSVPEELREDVIKGLI